MWQVEGISGAEDLWGPARRPWVGASGEVALHEGLIAGVKDWGLISACLCFQEGFDSPRRDCLGIVCSTKAVFQD